MKNDTLRELCCEANRKLPALGLVDLTFGNVSVADRQHGVFAIKPSGVGYDDLRPEDMVIVDFDGKIVEGSLRPSLDTATHARILRSFEGVSSVVHTHSHHATAWAQAGRPIPCLGMTHAAHFLGEVPVTRMLTPEDIGRGIDFATGELIVECFRNLSPKAVPAVLVAGHGPFVWGGSASKAIENAIALEIIAEMALKTLLIRPEAPPLPEQVLSKYYLSKHGPPPTRGQVY
jgi:L-ribulose-5-phosphate 4-epimerase